MKRYFAHSKHQTDGGVSLEDEWEPLFTPLGVSADECSALSCQHCKIRKADHGHLNKVAYWSATFAADMFTDNSCGAKSVRPWGYLTGLWHDLGKYSDEFQNYIRQSDSGSHEGEIKGRVDHATAGAKHIHNTNPEWGCLLSYLIAGHHAGLPDGIATSKASLANRLEKTIPNYQDNAPKSLLEFSAELDRAIFHSILKDKTRLGLDLSFFLRMLFSTLVDADFLATESFMAPEKTERRKTDLPDIHELEQCLTRYIENLQAVASSTPVNQARATVYDHCLQAAAKQPGFFSLTVPTGGGKTLSSLAFALAHACKYNLRRVIYVIPYTAIIEQNAKVFREALAQFGSEVVLEHHSNLDADEGKQSTWSRLAAENWDARVIVTTNVQFFESLHANRPSRCRKLHRIARSVVILDEAQNLPVEYLGPCLRTLEQLVENYGASVVLCTATQPAIERNDEFDIGIVQPEEIIPAPGKLYQDLRRVKCERLRTPLCNDALADKLAEHRQVLCIVNTRRHARNVFDLLPEGDRFHLSALMCPRHREDKLKEIKDRLDGGQPIRVVATQLVEAGVDIDFPVVYRAMAGLDSIAQAAGRCDREGRLTQRKGSPSGQMIVFAPDEPAPPGFIRGSAGSAAEVLNRTTGDPLDLDCIEEYFRLHYWKNKSHTDDKDILGCWPDKISEKDDFLRFKFKTCAENFYLIDDNYSLPVLVPYDTQGDALCKELKGTYHPQELRAIARKLQRYTVNIPEWQHRQLRNAGVLHALHDERFFVLASTSHYSLEYGLSTQEDFRLTPEDLIQ